MGRGPLIGLCERLGIHHATFAVCITSFGTSLAHTVFMFYYVKVFLGFHISEWWFQCAQFLFMLWNALNDPMFGYFQDMGNSWMRNRRKCILFGAPFFALSFLLPWFPWTDTETSSWITGIHMIVALFFYDGFFSFVMLAWSALFAENTTDHGGRVRAIKYTQIATLVAVNVVVVMEKLSDSLQDMGSFQMGTVVIALIAFCCWSYTGLYANDRIAQVHSFKHLTDNRKDTSSQTMPVAEGIRLTKQVLAARDFWAITLTNFLHTCRNVAHLNFASIITEALIPRDVLPLGSWQLSLFYGSLTVVPQIVIIANTRQIVKHGCYRMLMLSFYVSIITGLFAYTFASTYPYLVMAFMLIDSITVHSLSPLMNILFADFIDDDMVRHNRAAPLSSLIFSLNALIVKPAQSLSPMAIVYILNQYGYLDYQSVKNQGYDGKTFDDLKNCMFTLLCFLPALLGALEFAVFRRYSLRDRHLFDAHNLNSDMNKYVCVCVIAIYH